MRVAIVEDEREHAQKLNEFLMQYGREHNVEFTVDFFQNGVDFLSDYNPKTDIVFMDIELPHMNGMDCAVKLRKLDGNVPLIFVTNMIQYAIRGYEVDAIGYMLKPVVYFPFSMLMDKVIAKRQQISAKEIYIKSRDYVKRVSARDIYYVEIMDHYLIYHTTEGEYREIGKMKEIEEQLGDSDFFRCSNSYLVNLRFVQSIEQDEVVIKENGNQSKKVFISRRRKKDFLIALNDFLKKGGA